VIEDEETVLRLQKLTAEERKNIKEAATQTRFTWAVLLLTFVTVQIGLLALAHPYPSYDAEKTFLAVLTISYFFVTFATCYSFYALCRTTYLLDIITRYQWSEGSQNFLETEWGVFYIGLVRRNGKFDKTKVIVVSFLIGLVLILLMESKMSILYFP
jgi:hypothetical protein